MRRRETRLPREMLCVVLCLKGGVGGGEQGVWNGGWSKIPGCENITKALWRGPFGFAVATGDLGPGFIPHTMLLVVLGINRFVIEEIKSPFRAAWRWFVLFVECFPFLNHKFLCSLNYVLSLRSDVNEVWSDIKVEPHVLWCHVKLTESSIFLAFFQLIFAVLEKYVSVFG